MKVTAFVGSARKKHTFKATEKFLQHLQVLGDVEYEIIALSEYNLKTCRGCKLCLDRGEEKCPLKDDRDLLMEKIMQSDGVVFSSPNYAFQVSGLMKVFLDRFGFVLHRPRYFGKTFTSIVAQGIYGGKDIVKYLDFVGGGLGFNVVRGFCIKTLEPMTDEARRKTETLIEKQSIKYYRELVRKANPAPSLFKLMIYRLSRTSMKMILDDQYRDYTYFTEKGWFQSDYYYPVKLNPVKKTMGRLFDFAARKMAAG
ncbi:MAG TPA: flavodoxin family protein [Bacteroides sp.]|nr:flavodoxin family protein [Bacteroides sp.]